MELDARPEPGPEERVVLAKALAEVLPAAGDPDRSVWWHEGVRENVDEPAAI